mmetsp:Transcript_18537/g.26897  ORF Transcript_18537/g.26897 Transcript_18537/m.26897 type:complete len:104 (-) Transcript_18537:205-516(-)
MSKGKLASAWAPRRRRLALAHRLLAKQMTYRSEHGALHLIAHEALIITLLKEKHLAFMPTELILPKFATEILNLFCLIIFPLKVLSRSSSLHACVSGESNPSN